MTPAEIAVYAGGAMGYAAAGTAAIWVLSVLARRPLRPAGIGVALAALFVIFLGIHPFPDAARLDCTAGGARIILAPFDFMRGYVHWWKWDRSLGTALHSLSILAPFMNLVLFMPLGMALAGAGRRWTGALAVGAGVTLFIEIAQLTALFGIYPCRYRHFETGDLILNTLGVMLGFALMRLWLTRRAASGQPGYDRS